MSNTLTQARADLAALMASAGLPSVDHMAARPNPPVAVIAPGNPYVALGEVFGSFTITLTVLLLARTASNDLASDEVDDMAARLALAVHGSAFRLATVDQPASFQVNNATYLGATADVTLTTHLEVTE